MAHRPFDPMDPQHNLEAFVKMLGNTDESQQSINWYKGGIFSVIGDDEVNQHILGIEGFSVNRAELQDDGSYRNYQREVLYYTHPRTGEIIETWHNPFIDEEVQVKHVANDPVNSVYATVFKQKFGEDEEEVSFPFLLPWTFHGDLAMTSFDVNTRWANCLDPDVWKRESTGPWVRVSEHLSAYISKAELEDTKRTAIAYNGVWQRMGPWLPWMFMAGKPGHLFYRSHYRKIPGGVAELPQHIVDYTEKHYPKYLEAPKEWVTPNVTSFETYARDNEPAS